jgi:hypothetical protein
MFAIPLVELGVILFLYLFCKPRLKYQHRRVIKASSCSTSRGDITASKNPVSCLNYHVVLNILSTSSILPTQTFNMRSFLQLVLSVPCLVSCILAANLPQNGSQSAPQPTPGGKYYTVFPKNGTDISKTGDYIKELIGAVDLLPWSDVNDQLMHWTVEASPDQVSQLQGNTVIDHVTEFDPKAPPAATRSIRDTPAVE